MASSSKPVSSLAAALANHTHSLSIPKPRDAGHPGISQSLPNKRHGASGGGLPTPPNSLSPTLPPHKGRSPAILSEKTPLQPIESDIDLQDAPEERPALSTSALSGIDATGAITPAMLAKHHLPDILLHSGPLAIRYVLGHLTHNVPGFSRIPPAKARRLVVAALENRAGGGKNGDVIFEKVGWGRWDARLRGQPSRHRASANASATAAGHRGSSEDSWAMSEQEHDHVSEHEADKMSLDGEEDEPPRVTRRVPIIQAPSDDDMTEDEDWESMGPEALRLGSFDGSAFSRSRRNSQFSFSATSRARPIINPSQRSQQRLASLGGSGQPTSFSPDAFRALGYSGGITPFSRIVQSSSLSSSLRMMHGVSRRSISGSAGPASPAIGPTSAALSPFIHSVDESSRASPALSAEAANCGSPQEREAVEALLSLGGQ